jgi:hypothetical protein
MKKELAEMNLRNHLLHGDLNKIIEKSGATRGRVNWILSGKGFDEKILNAITEVIQDNKNRQQKVLENLKNALA